MNENAIEQIPIDTLIPYARNSRTHSAAQIDQIAASLREYGFTNPVLIDRHNGIIAGHGRVLAARQIGRVEVPCIRLSHLTDAQRRAYILADNKIAINAGWDDDLLADELQWLQTHAADIDIALTGFSDQEIERLLSADLGDIPEPENDIPTADPAEKLLTCPKCGCRFGVA